MNPPFGATYSMLADDDHPSLAQDGIQTNLDGMALAQPVYEEPARKRRRYNSRRTPAEWDQIKPDMKKLYVDEDRSLDETMAELQADCGFQASRDQFKSKIKLWGFDKKVKTHEMKHIIRIDKRRQPKKTSLTVRKQPVSRIKIERFLKERLSWPEPPSRTPSVISYRTSYSPEVTPSLTLNASPRLMPFEWFLNYEEYNNQAPDFSPHPMFKTLQKLRIQENTWELRKFKETQFTLLRDAYIATNIPDSNHHIQRCLGCVLHIVADFYTSARRANNDKNLPAEPSPRWWASEFSRILQSRIENIGIAEVSHFLHWSITARITAAADVFSEVCLELCRAEKSKPWGEIHAALGVVDYLILSGRLPAGETILRAIMKEDFQKIAVQFWNIDYDLLQEDDPWKSLYWRRSITQLIVIRWFLTHPDLRHNVFGNNDISGFSFIGDGVEINDNYHCLAEGCSDHFEFVSGAENFIEEDKITRDLIEEVDISEDERQCMLALLGLSRYLPRYGPFLSNNLAPQALDYKEQEQAGKQFEMEPEDQGRFLSTGLQLGQDLSDKQQDELDWWIMGSQRPLLDGHEVSSNFDRWSTSPRPGGYVLDLENLRSGEGGMRNDNESWTGRVGSPFQNNPTPTGHPGQHYFMQENQAGSMLVQTQSPLWPSTIHQTNSPKSMSMSTGFQDLEQQPSQDLNEQQTEMDIDRDLRLG